MTTKLNFPCVSPLSRVDLQSSSLFGQSFVKFGMRIRGKREIGRSSKSAEQLFRKGTQAADAITRESHLKFPLKISFTHEEGFHLRPRFHLGLKQKFHTEERCSVSGEKLRGIHVGDRGRKGKERTKLRSSSWEVQKSLCCPFRKLQIKSFTRIFIARARANVAAGPETFSLDPREIVDYTINEFRLEHSFHSRQLFYTILYRMLAWNLKARENSALNTITTPVIYMHICMYNI